ncbi:MAG: 3-deoxy-manno-octulosonate cytidylyltransferase [Campylobacterales bacterium]|nr:3-deoxy-manno-octulosonate cytidylyltransferase [Campylobacterales bacterium]
MIVIPARLASNRFPKKVLVDINGLPMVIATANKVKKLDDVVIATDSTEVEEVVKKHGFKSVMTSVEHKSGTDRINEAVNKLGLKSDELIINVQADEPFIEPEVVGKVITTLKNLDRDFKMASCYKKMDKWFATDPNHVKVITDIYGDAIYFSRSKIPFDREEHHEYFGHLGIYGFDKKSINEFCSLSPAPIEDIEKLEQLRAIYNGKKIAMVEVESKSFGIDSPEDLKRALEELV